MDERRIRNGSSNDAKATTLFDRHLGAKIRALRSSHCMTQAELGAALGITFQQVRKYENGTNRITAERLYKISRVFDVPIASLFDAALSAAGFEVAPSRPVIMHLPDRERA